MTEDLERKLVEAIVNRTDIADALDVLLGWLLAEHAGYSARPTDGVLMEHLRGDNRDVTVVAIVVMVTDQTVEPLRLHLSLTESKLALASALLCFGHSATTVKYGSREHRHLRNEMLANPDVNYPWKVALRRTIQGWHREPVNQPSGRLPETSNFYAQLRSEKPPRAVAELYGNAGWAVRKCGWNEFEVSCDLAELVIEATPVLVHGLVADPSKNFAVVTHPLLTDGVDFSCECYAPDGTLIFEHNSRPGDDR